MKDRIKRAYKNTCNIYDDTLTGSKWWSRLYIKAFWGGVDDTAIAEKVLSFIPQGFAGELLDVPVGTALFTYEKYKKIPEARIFCLDYSLDMLKKAGQRLKQIGITNVRFIQGDVGALPYKDKRFDIVLSMNGFHAFPDKGKAYYEIYRVLKKGGLFCGCFYIKGQSKKTDWLVETILSKRGWFTRPFVTLDELKSKLGSMYAVLLLEKEQSVAYFCCKKRS